MEKLLPFLQDRDYIVKKRIKSIKLFLRFNDEPSLPHELLSFKMEFNKNGTPKLITAHDRNGNIGEKTVYNEDGQKKLKIVNHNNTATFQKPEIDITTYEYQNGLLIREQEINESNYFGKYKKERHYKREFKYDNNKKLIEEIEIYLPNNSTSKKTYKYPTSNLKKEFDFINDGRINKIIFHKFNATGEKIEEKAVKTEEEYYDSNYKYQYYRHFYIYNSNRLLQEMQSFDNENKMKSSMKYHYDSKGYLTKVDFFENGQLSTAGRFEYKTIGLLNSIFN